MQKLIVKTNPVLPFEIFKVDADYTNISKIYQSQWSRQALDYLKDYALKSKEDIEVNFVGPESYVKHFVEEANTFEFVKASGTGV
jgi:hypothetical protein